MNRQGPNAATPVPLFAQLPHARQPVSVLVSAEAPPRLSLQCGNHGRDEVVEANCYGFRKIGLEAVRPHHQQQRVRKTALMKRLHL
ncbi:UNVERIFIED_CONTAM: hypothetical protein HHA_456610 [Hammondia hammondi]|eukprot:XP_008888975.1 hypothetical protein HHA_456610 [Hammondia hammondi]